MQLTSHDIRVAVLLTVHLLLTEGSALKHCLWLSYDCSCGWGCDCSYSHSYFNVISTAITMASATAVATAITVAVAIALPNLKLAWFYSPHC